MPINLHLYPTPSDLFVLALQAEMGANVPMGAEDAPCQANAHVALSDEHVTHDYLAFVDISASVLVPRGQLRLASEQASELGALARKALREALEQIKALVEKKLARLADTSGGPAKEGN